MTDARIEHIARDAWLAADFLKRARAFATDGQSPELQTESRQVLLHGAVVAACDAVLSVEGLKVEGSHGGHRLRLERAQALLAGDQTDLFELLDESRVTRNEVSYAAGFAAAPDVDETGAAVERLLALVEAHVRPHLPEWQSPG